MENREKRQPDSDVLRLRDEILVWEKEQSKTTLMKEVGTAIGKPIAWAIDKLPDRMNTFLAKSIEGLFGILILGMNYSYSRKDVLKRVNKRGGEAIKMDDLRAQPISALSKAAWTYTKENALAGALEGGGCGLGGFVLVAVDIPAVFGISFRAIQQIGATFGYDMDSPQEKQLMMRLIDFSSSAPTAAKVEAMYSKEVLLQYIKTTTIKQMEALAAVKAGQVSLEEAAKQMLKNQGKRATQKAVARMSAKLQAEAIRDGAKATAVVGARNFAKGIGSNLSKRKMGQLIPIIGAVIGAGFNYWLVNRTANAAYYFYLKRHIEEEYEIGSWEDGESK